MRRLTKTPDDSSRTPSKCRNLHVWDIADSADVQSLDPSFASIRMILTMISGLIIVWTTVSDIGPGRL